MSKKCTKSVMHVQSFCFANLRRSRRCYHGLWKHGFRLKKKVKFLFNYLLNHSFLVNSARIFRVESLESRFVLL